MRTNNSNNSNLTSTLGAISGERLTAALCSVTVFDLKRAGNLTILYTLLNGGDEESE